MELTKLTIRRRVTTFLAHARRSTGHSHVLTAVAGRERSVLPVSFFRRAGGLWRPPSRSALSHGETGLV